MFTIGAFAIIFDSEGRVLLSHRRDMDLWNLPGGRVESGELPTEAVIRETKEETGLDVLVEKLVGVYGKRKVDELVFAFRCSVVGGALDTTAEADRHAFFPIEALPKNTIPKHVERILDALEDEKAPLFKRQNQMSSKAWLEHLSDEAFSQRPQ